MADYGVNIAVAVKNSQAITKLSRDTKTLSGQINNVNKNIEDYADLVGKAVVNSTANFSKALQDAAANLNKVALNGDKATKAARDFLDAQLLSNEALKEQKQLLREVFLAGKPVQATPFGPQPFSPQKQLADEGKARARLLAIEANKESKLRQEKFQATSDFLNKMHSLEISLGKKANSMEIDNIIKEFEIKERLEKDAFNNAIKRDKEDGRKFMEQLGFKKTAELDAIAEVDRARKKAAGEAINLTGQTSPIGGAVGIPGSPAALAAEERARRLQSARGSALIGGAFPLLFGQGLGAAAGGAAGGFGGGMVGGEFGFGLSLVGTQIGSMIDQLAAQAASLGAALNPATADVNAIVESLGMVGSPAQDAIQSLEELAGEQVALEEATRQLSLVVGDEGVEALAAFGDASTRFSNALTQVTTQILAQIARLAGPIAKEIATSMEVGALLSAAQASKDPRQVALQKKLAAQPVQAGAKGMPTLERVKIEKEMVELQKKIRQEEEKRLQAKVEAARVGSAEHVIAKNDLAIAQLNGDLTNDRIFNLKKANIFQKARAKAQEKGADLALIELERNQQLKELENERADLIARANEKSARLSDREERKKQRAIERATKAVEKEMERTDKAFDRASSQLDDIINKHEDKMAFEREYSRLIQEGSTPAAAKQAIELKKQLLELDRQYTKLLKAVDAQILKTEASIADLKAQAGVTTEYEKQVKALEDLKKKKEELEGKKGKAKGAITKDLAPETGAEKIEEEMERVQGSLNKLLDPANQVILAAQAIGDAFSESFKGLITGSMSAQEALANLFSRTADHFADMAAQIIAKQIQMQILGIGLNLFGSAASAGSFSQAPSAAAQAAGANAFKQPAVPFTLGFAEGGHVSGPTRALIGEGGESEYVIPESKMRESMARYSRGARGSAVIPETGTSGTLGESSGTAVAAPIDVRYTVERINSVDYVTADQFQRGMQQAASQGAKQGEQQTLKRLQMSGSTRKRIGL